MVNESLTSGIAAGSCVAMTSSHEVEAILADFSRRISAQRYSIAKRLLEIRRHAD
jgi:hypothetical protein